MWKLISKLVGDILSFSIHWIGWGILESDILILWTFVFLTDADTDIDQFKEIVKLVNLIDYK